MLNVNLKQLKLMWTVLLCDRVFIPHGLGEIVSFLIITITHAHLHDPGWRFITHCDLFLSYLSCHVAHCITSLLLPFLQGNLPFNNNEVVHAGYIVLLSTRDA